jgi:Asp-tRNA(Asn)/Glu-tRNA(Gln) amidotransferase A subunit family amidase
VPEKAEAWAADADERQARGGPLHGLPVAHKDAVMIAGIRSTMGSPLLKDHVPERDDLLVERLRNAGEITIGKTSMPEFDVLQLAYAFPQASEHWNRRPKLILPWQKIMAMPRILIQ